MPEDSTPPATLPPRLAFGDCVLDLAGGRLLRLGRPIALAPRPFAVLAYLAGRPGQLVSKDELLDTVWGHRHVSDSVLKVAVNAVRQALGEDAAVPRYLHTVPRRGYRFELATPRLATAAADEGQERRPTASAPPAAGHLPPPPPLIGREAELRALAAPPAPLLTLIGPGGVGKTALALNLAQRWTSPADGTWLLRLDALTDPAQLVDAVATALALPAGSARDVTSLARALAPLQMRVVLDNAEHLVADVASLVVAVSAAAPGVQWLVTSQRPLGVAGEQLWPVPPLPWPTRETPRAGWADLPACALFVQRVRARLPAYTPDVATGQDIASICERLDGLPLALELAAARVPLLGTGGVRARLDDRLAVLTGGTRDASPRHRTLQAALRWSWDLLPPSAQRLLMALSVAVGSFDLPLVASLAEVPEQVLDDLQTLLDASWLQVVDAGDLPRWRLLDSVRLFASANAASHGGTAAAQRRLESAMLERWRGAEAAYLTTPLLDWLRPLAVDAGHLDQALRNLVARAQVEPEARGAAIDLASAAVLYGARAGHRQDALHWLRAVQPWVDATADDERRGRWQLSAALLGIYGQVLPPEETLAAATQAAERLEAVADRPRALLARYAQAQVQLRLRHAVPERQAVLRQMQVLAGERPEPNLRTLVGWIEALLARDQGDLRTYLDLCTDFLARARAIGDRAQAWTAAWGLAQGLVLRRDIPAAMGLLDNAVAEIRALGLQRQYATLVALAASVRLGVDASPATVVLAREATVLLRSEGMLWWMSDALARLALWQGRWADAARLQAWADARAAGESRGPVFAWLREGFVLPDLAAGSATVQEVSAVGAETLGDAAVLALAFDERARTRSA